MKVTIITVVLNCADYLEECINSVISQDYDNIEYVVIDGGSTDGTISIINKYKDKIAYFITEEDQGIYDALNKGIKVASGDLIGTLNSDDWLATNDAISSIVRCFKLNSCEIVYGNLNFTKRSDTTKITRRWRPGSYRFKKLKYGWMPPHPTLYLKRGAVIHDLTYSLDFGTCGDYDFVLKVMCKKNLKAIFLDKLIVNMRTGGMSNGSLKKIIFGLIDDYRVLLNSGLPKPLLILFFKKIRKMGQFILFSQEMSFHSKT